MKDKMLAICRPLQKVDNTWTFLNGIVGKVQVVEEESDGGLIKSPSLWTYFNKPRSF